MINRACSLVVLAAIGCGRNSPQNATPVPSAVASPTAVPIALPTATAIATAIPTPAPSANEALVFQIATNIEMVPYCLPFPSTYLKEDFSERWEHGRKVFTKPQAHGSNVPPSRMEFQGTCGPRSLKQIYEDDRKAIIAEVGEKAITVSALREKSFALSWKNGQRIRYGKMWIAPNDPGCFVRATFDYQESDRAAFDTIIAKVASSDPACPKGS